MRYVIQMVVNNNIVCSADEEGNEVIVRGKGIGFQKKKGMTVEEEAVEKIYRMDSKKDTDKLQELLSEIPPEHFETCSEIIESVENTLKKKLNRRIYITLTDHISFAIERKKQKIEYKNALLWEIKNFYSKEYQLGLEALDIIEKKLKVRLSEDEAGFIALHIVNAQLDTKMDNTMEITKLIAGILSIVRKYYEIELNQDSLDYERFLTHLKFFGQRLYKNKNPRKGDPVFHDMIKERYFTDYHCAEEIRGYIESTFHHEVSSDEMVFLTVHLRRISTAE